MRTKSIARSGRGGTTGRRSSHRAYLLILAVFIEAHVHGILRMTVPGQIPVDVRPSVIGLIRFLRQSVPIRPHRLVEPDCLGAAAIATAALKIKTAATKFSLNWLMKPRAIPILRLRIAGTRRRNDGKLRLIRSAR